ncbi:MAG TPA: Calx-beta domain-containing protein [Gaiellaceae bacterium]|nr:Calx-beta domain-containing protein [Gaiellaceae bacterium]
MRERRLELNGKTVRIGLAAAFGLFVLVSLGLLAGVGFNGLSSVARAYEYSTTITTTTTTSTSTTTTTTPTSTKPGKGCGDKNHLHERRFECKVVISDVSKKEGNSGTTTFVFTLTLSGSPLSTVTVDYATADGTAIAGSDYLSASGTATFSVGVTTKTITVSVLGNTTRAPNKTFYVNLLNPSANAYLGDAQAVGTIYNDD